MRLSSFLLSAAAAAVAAPAVGQSHLFTFRGNAAGDALGWSVDQVGDLNGDGFNDVAVGIPGSDSLRVLSGATGAAILTTTRGNGDRFGAVVRGVGDVDGDSTPDLLVGAPLADVGPTDSGVVYLLSGRSAQPIYQWVGAAAGDQFGFALDGLGDIDGDSVPDVIVGAPFSDSVAVDAGLVQVFSGATGAVLATVAGGAAGDQFGYAVAGVGDIDGNGKPDACIGARGVDANGTDSGMALVISVPSATVIYRFLGDAAGDLLGHAVAGAGDFDRDGSPDLVVGAPRADCTLADVGLARVYSGRTGMVLLSTCGASAGELFGFSVDGAGDVDGDGDDEVLVGAPQYDSATGGANTGSARVLGTTKPGLVFEGDDVGDQLGYAVAGAGDVNRDGFPDLLVGVPGDDDNGFTSGSARVLSGDALALSADIHEISLSRGGQQLLMLDGTTGRANVAYWVLGSMSGTTPGLNFGPLTLPLNPDPYLRCTVSLPNQPPLQGSQGSLDPLGRAQATFSLPAGLPASLFGMTLHHAFVTALATPFASGAVPLTIVW